MNQPRNAWICLDSAWFCLMVLREMVAKPLPNKSIVKTIPSTGYHWISLDLQKRWGQHALTSTACETDEMG